MGGIGTSEYHDMETLIIFTWNSFNFAICFDRFAKWGEVHRENVEAIRDASGWMVALRYDVKIRTSAFRVKCSNGTMEGTPDIRKRRKDVEEECYAESRRFNELGYGSEIPYSKGGDRVDWNPRNGQPKQQHTKYNVQKQNSNFIPQSSSGTGRGGYSGRGGAKGGRSGYRGPPELFDPNFAEKRAAAASKKNTS